MVVTAKRDLIALALAPSATEREKAERTHNMIRGHLESDQSLARYHVSTYLQGSYKNSTNVRGDSDVDMGCFTTEVFFYDTTWLPKEPRYQYGSPTLSLKESVEQEIKSGGPVGFTFWDYRADVLASLTREYGASVKDGNKAIGVLHNTSRLDADVLPCFSFRQYYQDWKGQATYHKGIQFFTKSFEPVVNFPHQHFENLTAKNQRTDGMVKGCIRILKRFRNEFEDAGEWDRRRSPSYYLEGLLWNVPDNFFDGGYPTVLRDVLRFLWQDLTDKKASGELTKYNQANDIFYLFHPKFWNVDDALAFIEKLWLAAGFEE